MCKKLACLISFVAALTVAQSASAGPVGHWRFDEGSGTVAVDSSGKGNDGTILGNAAWVTGRIGSALDFDGSDDIVILDDDPSLDIEDALTICLWVNAPDVVAPNHMVTKQPSGTAGTNYPGNYEFRIKSNTIQFLHQTSQGTNYSLYQSASPIMAGEWHHAAVSIVEGGFVELYLDGASAGSVAQSGTLGVLNDESLRIGGRKDSKFFNGILDDVYIYNRALTPDQIEGLRDGIVPAFSKAEKPSMQDGAVYENTWATLGWTPGESAVSHNVYIGSNFDDVNNGTGETFRGNQTENVYLVGLPGYAYPDGLVAGTTYYWRIDEVNNADPNSPWKGDVWSFSIAPSTAYNPNPADGAGSVALNATLNWTGGFGSKLHTVYFGDKYDDVNSATTGAMSATATYDPGPLQSQKVYYWRVDEFDGATTHKGQVWSFATLGALDNPHPANGAADAEMNTILTWAPSENAASHQVYLGTDKEALRKADTTSPEYKGVKALGAESYDPGLLAWDSTYYWRIDEVNNTNPASPWKGPLWTFTTGQYLLVEDFEAYNDIDPPAAGSNRIFDKWIDGFGTATNGAVVGNNLPPYTARSNVHGGGQAMPFSYDNNLKFSEATMTLAGAACDWTRQGVANLSLWFRGATANAAERMYVTLNGTAVVYHDNPAATQLTGWTEWVIPLQQFTALGVNLTNVTSITIGFGTRGNTTVASGTGQMYFDDIRLYRPVTP